jgi:hypothetical protein
MSVGQSFGDRYSDSRLMWPEERPRGSNESMNTFAVRQAQVSESDFTTVHNITMFHEHK